MGREQRGKGGRGLGRSGGSAKLREEALASWTEGGRSGRREEGQLDIQRSRRQWQSPGHGHGAPGAAGALRGPAAGLRVHRGSPRAPALTQGVWGVWKLQSFQVLRSQGERGGLV